MHTQSHFHFGVSGKVFDAIELLDFIRRIKADFVRARVCTFRLTIPMIARNAYYVSDLNMKIY